MFKPLLAASVLALALPSAATAALVSLDLDFTVSDFRRTSLTPGAFPAGPVSGSFKVAFDNAASVSSGSLTALSFNFGGVAYNTANTTFQYHKPSDTLFLSSLPLNVLSIGQDGFVMRFNGVAGPGLPTFSSFQFTSNENQGVFTADFRQVANVPEPATWGMMIGGFGLLGAIARRSRTQITYA